MERTDYVAKAKSLLKNSALVILPLAMATAAAAAPVLPIDNPTCVSFGTDPFSSCAIGVAPISTPGLTGVEFYTPGVHTLIASGSGTSTPTGPFMQWFVMETFTAGFTDVLPGSLPVFYNFSLMQDPAVTIGLWRLRMEFQGVYSGSIAFTGFGAGDFSGQGIVNLTFDSLETGQALSANLEVNGTRTADQQVLLYVPQGGSFDFGASAAVPEPATLGIAGAGLALAAWLGRRRNTASSPQ